MKTTLPVLIALLFLACSPKQNPNALFKLMSSDQTGIDFSNVVEDQSDFNVLTYRNYYNGGGVAIGDINNDGLADIYFTANMAPNKLYLNKGNFQFDDISDEAGVSGSMSWSTGVTMADVNGDGHMDIYVCNSGDVDGDKKRNELFINNGDLTFSEKANEFGVDDSGFSTHGSFFDYDRDGDLDLYLANNSFKDPSRIDFTNVRNQRDQEGGDKLFRNDNDQFVDVSEQAGIYGSKIGFGLGVSVSDINGDSWPDIYISNDFWERDYLYINQKNGTFSEELTERISMTSTASMGADIADLNNDGSFEIFSTDMLPATNQKVKETTIFNGYNLEDLRYRNDYHYQYTQNCLQVNDGSGNFREVAHLTGVASTDWSWAALCFDFDNDGLKDIFVSNGVQRDITNLDFSNFLEDKEEVAKVVEEKGRFNFKDFLPFLPSNKVSNYAFKNQGDLTFNNEATELGLGTPSFSNGSAYADLDNDGDLDLVVNNINAEAFVYQNQSDLNSENNFISLSFKSDGKNKFGIGVIVEIKAGEKTLIHQNYQSRGFQSSTTPEAVIGIGKADNIDELKVTWPSGKCSTYQNVQINSNLLIEEKDASICTTIDNLVTTTFMESDALEGVTTQKHVENLFNDFDYEKLMPHMVSTEGPKTLIGDLDGDGLEDVVLLSAFESEDKVLLQAGNGSFSIKEQDSFNSTNESESTCGLLIDLDQDGDLDILIGSGGNDPRLKPQDYLLRVYTNNGNAEFIENKNSTLKALGNFSIIESIQLTPSRRGIFIGSRIIPGNYGLTPRSYLFAENGVNNWVDITDQSTGPIGMVTDAKSIDLDNDNQEDLVVIGEWMPVKIYQNQSGSLTHIGSVENSNGMWQTLNTADLNNDGFEDLVLGNWGNNSKLQASKEKPLTMIVGDFDQNQKSECIIQWFAPEDDETTVFASKDDLAGQLPIIKKSTIKNSEYAQKKLDGLLSSEQLERGKMHLINNLNSSVLYNRGGLRFDLTSLPDAAQYAPVFAIHINDFTNDGKMDIILGGNMYGLKPEIGRLDSSNGLLLSGNEDESFTSVKSIQSGINIKGQIRSIIPITLSSNEEVLLVGINNANYQILKKTRTD